MLEFADLPVIDCHTHFGLGRVNVPRDELKRLEAFMLNVIREGRLNKMYITGVNGGLYLKAKYPGLFYAGGFVPWSGMTNIMPNPNWEEYIGSLIKARFDGIGELGSKPVPRQKHTPFDSEYYAGFWDHCESIGYPILVHVADPEEFWDEKLAPDWAKKRNWVYYKGDYPSKEELYQEMENILNRHPKLKVVLAHFYFMSADLERAADFLDRHKYANFDLALGIELMYNISRRRDDWREFFVKYQARIFFGTDIGTWQSLQESLGRIWLLRNFLESDEEFYTQPTADSLLTKYKEPFIGLNLPEDVLRKIYAENFQRLWGKEPRKVNLEIAIKKCEEVGEETLADALRRLV